VEMAGIEPASKKFDQRYTTDIFGLKVLVGLIPADKDHGPPADGSLAGYIGVKPTASRISRRPFSRSRAKQRDGRDRLIDQLAFAFNRNYAARA